MSNPTPVRTPFLHVGHPEGHIPLFDPPDSPSKPLAKWVIGLMLVLGVLAGLGGWQLEHIAHGATAPNVALPWIIPFALLLGSIALMPFIAKHFWEHNYHWFALILGAIVSAYYIFGLGYQGVQALSKSFAEYIAFILLLGSLFIISGGILIRVRRKATPLTNTTILLIGAIIANIFGTTGASMLLIRPFIRINKGHIRPYHIVFFIFSVSNLGGSLTPIGDPPLFLGFLKGVPFWWVLEHCWPMWCVSVGAVLAIFFVFDTYSHRKDTRAPHDEKDLGPAISIYGAGNIVFIAMVLVGVFMPPPFREIMMVVAACGSLWMTSRRIHVENVFNFAPIKEVALLFIGIFATMVPALNYLANNAKDGDFLKTPGQFYFVSGTLSSVLDNAPTYLTFLEAELGKLDKNLIAVATDVVKDPTKSKPAEADYQKLWAMNPERYADQAAREEDKGILDAAVGSLVKYHGDKVQSGKLTADQIRVGFLLGHPELNFYLIAISLGAVFFGAMTYIGNGPNFMVKSIAENAGVQCPSFFGYVFRYSIPILLPVLILIWAIFLMSHTGH